MKLFYSEKSYFGCLMIYMYVFKRTSKAEKRLEEEFPTVDCNKSHANNGAVTGRPAYLATCSRLSRNITGFSSKVVDYRRPWIVMFRGNEARLHIIRSIRKDQMKGKW